MGNVHFPETPLFCLSIFSITRCTWLFNYFAVILWQKTPHVHVVLLYKMLCKRKNNKYITKKKIFKNSTSCKVCDHSTPGRWSRKYVINHANVCWKISLFIFFPKSLIWCTIIILGIVNDRWESYIYFHFHTICCTTMIGYMVSSSGNNILFMRKC